jgi:hypothetical protein
MEEISLIENNIYNYIFCDDHFYHWNK